MADYKNIFQSIRVKLLLSFSIILVVLLIFTVTLVILNFKTIRNYEKITDNLVLENSFNTLVPQLIDSYSIVINSKGSQSKLEEYDALVSEINSTIMQLDSSLIDKSSRTYYVPLKNYVLYIVNRCDEGVIKLKEGDSVSAITIYQEDIVPVKSFLTENTAALIINELNHAKILQLQIEHQNSMIVFSLGVILAILIFGMILFVVFLSRSIISPITRLSVFAKEVSDGKIDKKISEDLLISQDETGSLARSFNVMLTRLNLEIDTQKKANNSLMLAEKKLEQINIKLASANTDLKSLDRQKDEFISLVAHELKTPLTSIRGFTQVLLDKQMSVNKAERIHYLELIDTNSQRLYTLVNDIVDSSRLDLGKLVFHIDEIDIYKLFNQIKDDMSITISKKGLTPKFIIEKKLPNIKADFERTLQVLHNLISNSIKFTTKGSISLQINQEGKFIKFRIIDTGQGIPAENKGKLFSRFYQVDSSLTRKVGGSGLGLSICKGMVENMGGQIGFDSEPGKGSTFYFTLPIADSKPKK